MTGKQIADNLRANRDKWGRFKYYHEGKYCVIGLKLKELGVNVEELHPSLQGNVVSLLEHKSGAKIRDNSLTRLQRANDGRPNGKWSVDDVIAFCESEAETNFPLEELAAAIKAKPPLPDEFNS